MLHILKKTYENGVKVHETRMTSCKTRARLVEDLQAIADTAQRGGVSYIHEYLYWQLQAVHTGSCMEPYHFGRGEADGTTYVIVNNDGYCV